MMTDDESRKAFEAWSLQRCGVPLRSDVYATFSAPDVLDAIQWATKRERERCGKIIDAFSDGYLLDTAEVINGALKKIFEESNL